MGEEGELRRAWALVGVLSASHFRSLILKCEFEHLLVVNVCVRFGWLLVVRSLSPGVDVSDLECKFLL